MSRELVSAAALVACLALAQLVPPEAGATELVVDPEASELVVRLEPGGVGAALAHAHVVEATRIDGRVVWNPDHPQLAEVTVRADARSLVADDPRLRERYGLEEELPEAKRAKVQARMESPSQMDVARYPEMIFESTAVTPMAEGLLEVTGNLTLHGRTREVVFRTSPRTEGDILRADAQLELLQSDFGIEPYRAFLGTIRNRDRVRLMIHLVARPAAGGEPAAE